MTDDFEHEVRAMLQSKGSEIADAHEPGDIPARAKRRRSLKLGAFSSLSIATVVLVVALVASIVGADGGKKSSVAVAPKTDDSVPLTPCPAPPGDKGVHRSTTYEVKIADASDLAGYRGQIVDGQQPYEQTALAPAGWQCASLRPGQISNAATTVISPRVTPDGVNQGGPTSVLIYYDYVRVQNDVPCWLFGKRSEWTKYMPAGENPCPLGEAQNVKVMPGGAYEVWQAEARGNQLTVGLLKPRAGRMFYNMLQCAGLEASVCQRIADDYVAHNGPDTESNNTATTAALPTTTTIRPTQSAERGGTVSPDGRVGPLRLDVSSEADIVRAFGEPDTRLAGSFNVPSSTDPAQDKPGYQFLGYGCTVSKLVSRANLGKYECRDVFVMNEATNLLVGLLSRSPEWTSPAGSQVGMAFADVGQRERINVDSAGCRAMTYLVGDEKQPATLLLQGGSDYTEPLQSLVMESNRNPVGLTFC